MGTHGSILVKEKNSKMFLNTTHDGHFIEAFKMLLTLPVAIAEEHGSIKYLIEYKDKPINREWVREHVEHSLPFEWALTTVAHAITYQHFCRWLILPPTWVKHLDIDAEPMLTLDITDPYAVKIKITGGDDGDPETLEQVSAVLRDFIETWPGIDIAITKSKLTTTVSYADLYVEALYCRAVKLQNQMNALKAKTT